MRYDSRTAVIVVVYMKAFSFRVFGILFWGAVTIHGAAEPVSFVVSPAHPMVDEPVRIAVRGLASNTRFILRAKSQAQDHLWWRSEITINSGQDGEIDLGSEAPVAGSYRGVDAMGLFWSMKPDTEPATADHAFFSVKDFFKTIDTNVEVVEAGNVIGSVTIQRRYADPNVRCSALRDAGLHGLLCFPGDGRPHPGVLVIGGSEGGIGLPDVTTLLASHGFTALSLAYFGEAGLPATLQNIPIEYFKQAADWMITRPEVSSRQISLFGVSRGTEAALQLASMSPAIDAVVVRSPSFARWEGISSQGLPGGPAWTLSGKPLPYIPNRVPAWFWAQYQEDRRLSKPIRQTPLFLYDLSIFGATDSVEIPVEKIRGPILLLSGKDDQIWPGDLMANKLMSRLKNHRHPYRDMHLSYDNVGHSIPCEYLPTSGDFGALKVVLGGTAEGVAKAQRDSWPRILSFLSHAANTIPSH